MTAIAWATYGLILATVGILAGALFTAISRSDALRSGLEARIDNLGSELRAEIRGLRGEFDGLRGELNSFRSDTSSRFDRLHDDLHEVRESVAGLDRRLTATGG